MQFLLKSASLKLSIREKCYFYIQIDSELKDMEKFTLEKELIRTTIYIVSPAINTIANRSNLYNPSYKHLFRGK